MRKLYLWGCEGKKHVSVAFHLDHSPWGAVLMFKCVWVCMYSHFSPQDPVESLPTQRVMNVGPLWQPLRVSHYSSVSRQPSLPVSPHSLVDPTERTKLALRWLIRLPAWPPTSTQPHKAVPHHQMWWFLVLILVWGLNISADMVSFHC